MLSVFRSVMGALARVVNRFPLPVVALGLLLTGLGLWLTFTKLTIINDTSALIRGDSVVNRNYLQYKQEFGASEEFIFIIRSPDVEKNRQVADTLGHQLRQIPDVRNVLDRYDFSRVEHRLLLKLDKATLEQIEAQIQQQAQVLRKQDVHFDLNSMLDQVNAKFNDKYLRKASNWTEFKPFIDQFINLLNSLADELEGKSPPKAKPVAKPGKIKAGDEARAQMQDLKKEMENHEYNSFADGEMYLVIAEPGPLPKGESSYEAVVKKLRTLQAQVRAQYPGVSIGLTGEPILDQDQLDTSSRDSLISGILAFFLVALLFFAGYRTLTRPALALLVLAMGLAITLGYAVLSVGHLNIISTAVVAMVIGLGIDFGIQIMGRYEEELANGSGIETAVETTLQNTGLAILTGGSTTSAAFFTMCFNDFVGLAEFGIIAGGGILICLALSLTVLPALYVLRDRRRSPDRVIAQAKASSWSNWGGLNDRLVRFPKTVLASALLITAVCALGWSKIGFDYNLLHLQNPQLESVREVQSLLNSPAGSITPAISVANNLEEARARIARFEGLSTVKSTGSAVDFFPTETEEKLVIIRRIVGSLKGLNLKTDVKSQIDVAKARTQLNELLVSSEQGRQQAEKYLKISKLLKDHRAADAVDVFSKLIPPVQRALDAMSKLSQEEIGKRLYRYQLENLDVMRNNLQWLSELATDRGIEPQDLPNEIRQRYISPQGKYLIEVFPKENIWDREPDVKFVQELRTVDPNVTGTPIQNYEYIDLLRTSYVKAAWYSFAAIVILIALHFRHVGYTLLTILPLALGITWTLGIMAWCGIEFNPANIVTLPLVIGVGVAYGVYTVDRFREDGSMRLFSNSTGKAIALSALTAIIGFGSMMISSYRGLHSLGVVMALGVSMCLINCLIVLPQILHLLSKRSAQTN